MLVVADKAESTVSSDYVKEFISSQYISEEEQLKAKDARLDPWRRVKLFLSDRPFNILMAPNQSPWAWDNTNQTEATTVIQESLVHSHLPCHLTACEVHLTLTY